MLPGTVFTLFSDYVLAYLIQINVVLMRACDAENEAHVSFW